MKFPHPLTLMCGCVLLAAAASHVLPPGEYDRRDDPVTSRRIVVAGTYHAVAPRPVGAFQALVAIPRGMADAARIGRLPASFVAPVSVRRGGRWKSIQAEARLTQKQAQSAGSAPAKADLSSLTSMLQNKWKSGSAASTKADELRAGQIHSFKITKLDAEAKKIEVALE